MTTKSKLLLGLVITALIVLIAIKFISPSTPLSVLAEKTANADAIRTIAAEKYGAKEIEFTEATYNEMTTRGGQDLAAKTGVFDVLLEYPLSLSTYASKGWIVPVADYASIAKPDVQDLLARASAGIPANVWNEIGAIDDGASNIKAYGYPFAANSMLLCYNKQMFENPDNRARFKAQHGRELGVPASWPEYVEVAEFFHAPPRSFGTSMAGDTYWIYWEWSNLAFSMGGGVMRKQYGWQRPPNTDVILDSAETKAATKLWKRLTALNSRPDFLQCSVEQQVNAMRGNNVALCLLWSDNAYTLINGPAGTSYRDMFGFAPIPGKKSMIAGGAFLLNAASRRKEQALEFISYLLQPEVQIKLARQGLCSPLDAVYDDPEVRKLPYAAAMRQSLKNGVYMLDCALDNDKIATILSDHLQRVFRGEEEVDAALDAAAREIKAERVKILNVAP